MSIQVFNISKKFNIGFYEKKGSLAAVISFIKGKEGKKEIEVLKNISFDIKAGQVLGLVGKNGSGKSTLLRIIAGIYVPDKGHIKTSGKVCYLSGLSNGLNLRLTLEDNIYFVGSVMGISKKEMKKIFNEIIEFSGLKDFIYTKVYQFSSGMISRLAFSITIHCLELLKPDALILDEVFGSGADLEFEKKAIKKMSELTKKGSAVILATHELDIVKNHCSRAICIENGQIVKEGDVNSVISFYKQKYLI